MRPIALLALVSLVGCSEYEWHSNLDRGVEPSLTLPADGGEDAPADEGTVPWEGGEDPAPSPYDGQSAFRPETPEDEGSTGAVPPEGDDADEDAPGDDEDLPGEDEDEDAPGDDEGEVPGDGSEPPAGTTPPADLDGDGRMTGGGSTWDGEIRVTHGFTLRCDGSHARLQVNWEGHAFHLEQLDTIACWDDPGLDPMPRRADFDTLWAAGTGRLDGVSGVPFEILFTDDGEPGTTDTAEIVIDGGAAVWAASAVDRGNHQAHGSGNLPPPEGRVPTALELSAAGLRVPGERALGAGCATAPGGPLAAGWILIGALGLARRRSD